MTPGFMHLDRYRTKFYQKEVGSKMFRELSEDQLAIVAKKVYSLQSAIADTHPGVLDKYQRTLYYLTNPLIHLELGTFDERMAFMIMMMDPHLITFKEFLKLDLPSIADISKVEDINERNRLMDIRSHVLLKYEECIREKIGFYDVKVLKYEELFFRRFYNEKELITEVLNSNPDRLISKTIIKDFSSISDDRYAELVNIAQSWLSLAPNRYNSKVAAYSVMYQNKLLGINTVPEQVALFILLVDSNLDMLRIFEEESMMPMVESRIIEEFGYYNKELLNLEKKFHNRFCPDKRVSIWTKTKKD